MAATVEHRRLIEQQIVEYWRSYLLACLQGRWTSAAEAMEKIDLRLERLSGDR